MELVHVSSFSVEQASDLRKKSRWVQSKYSSRTANRFSKTAVEKQFVPPSFIDLPTGLSPQEVDQFFREQRVDELTRKLRGNALELGDPEIRSPSPPPSYDRNGMRTNHREVRVKRSMEEEFARLNRFLVKRVPGYMPAGDLYRNVKICKKVEIPASPDVNFVAVIVGPRGINHKRLQDESRTRIEFRGVDSSSNSQSFEESEMPLHVHIEADTDEDMELALNLVLPLLNPASLEFQQAQIGSSETLALLSGQQSSLRCSICQSTKHSSSNCPDSPMLLSTTAADIRCAICNGKGHVTMDCPKGISSATNVLEVYSIPARSNASSPASIPSTPILLPSNIIGTFIGVQGCNIKRLMVETGCNIQVDQSKTSQGILSQCPLIFTGPPDAVSKARLVCSEWIEKCIKQREEQGQQRMMAGLSSGGFTDPEAAAQAVQMAYYQQMMWQAWVAQYGAFPPPPPPK